MSVFDVIRPEKIAHEPKALVQSTVKVQKLEEVSKISLSICSENMVDIHVMFI